MAGEIDFADPESTGKYSGAVPRDIVKGWNDRRKSSNIELSSLTPFVQLIGLFNPLEIKKMFSQDITTVKRKVYFDDGDTPKSLGAPQPDDPEKPSHYDGINKQITARSINIYFSETSNPQGRGAPIDGIILAETRSQADPNNYKGGVGITDLQIDYGKSSAMQSRMYKLRITINDPQLINDHVEYSKLATMSGEFVILYGWTNPSTINGFDSLPAPVEEPDPAALPKNKMVIPLNGYGTGGYWQAAKASILSYDFSFNEVGHIEIAVNLLDKTSLMMARQKVGPLAPFMKTVFGLEEHNSQGAEVGEPNYPSGSFDQIMIKTSNDETMSIADAIASNQEQNKLDGANAIAGAVAAGYVPADDDMNRLLGAVDSQDIGNAFAQFELTVDQILPGAEEATPAESQQVNMQEHIRRDKEKQLREFPFAGTGIRVYEKINKYVPLGDEIDDDTGEPVMEAIPAYNIKTTHYYMGWVLEAMKLGMQDANKHKIRMGEKPAIPNFTYMNNPDADQISNVFQRQQSAKQHGEMGQRIQDAIIRLKEKCIPPFRARTPDSDVVDAVGGVPSNAQQGSVPINFETSPCKNKVVIENIHELITSFKSTAEELITLIKERAGLTDADIEAMEQPAIDGEAFRGHVFEVTVKLRLKKGTQIGGIELTGDARDRNVTVRAFIPDTNFDPSNPTDYDITKSRLYDPDLSVSEFIPGTSTTLDDRSQIDRDRTMLKRLETQPKRERGNDKARKQRRRQIKELTERVAHYDAMVNKSAGEDPANLLNQGALEASALKAQELGYVGDSWQDIVRGKFFFFLRCEWRKAPSTTSASFLGGTVAATTGLSPIGMVAGAGVSALYKEYWKTGQIVGRYKIMDPDEARMYVNWELIQRKWYNLHVKSLTTQIEQIIYSRIAELETEGRQVEEIYDEPIDLDWLTGWNFNWNALIGKSGGSYDNQIRTYEDIKGKWQDTTGIGDVTVSASQRIDEYDKDMEDIEAALLEVGGKLRTKLNFIEIHKESIERKTGGRFDRTVDFEGTTRRGDNFYKFDKLINVMADLNASQKAKADEGDLLTEPEPGASQQSRADEDPAIQIPVQGQSSLLSYDFDDDEVAVTGNGEEEQATIDDWIAETRRKAGIT